MVHLMCVKGHAHNDDFMTLLVKRRPANGFRLATPFEGIKSIEIMATNVNPVYASDPLD